jgi:hypothetical protein
MSHLYLAWLTGLVVQPSKEDLSRKKSHNDTYPTSADQTKGYDSLFELLVYGRLRK